MALANIKEAPTADKAAATARLLDLQSESATLEASPKQREEWGRIVVQKYAEEFLHDLPESAAFIEPTFMTAEEAFGPITEAPMAMSDLVQRFDEGIVKEGMVTGSGTDFSFIPGSGFYTSALGDFLAAVTNKFSGVKYAAPGAVKLENHLIRWMSDMVGYNRSDKPAGNLTSGGSMAHLIAMAAARDAKGLKAVDYARAVVYVTSQVHHSVRKALNTAGMRETTISVIAVDSNMRMDIKALKQQIIKDKNIGLAPFMLVASAGTTNSGSVDPLESVASVAEKEKLWFHVDAAYGGFFLLSPEIKGRLVGIERSNSTVLDPHKSLFLPYGTGAVLVRVGQHLVQSNRANIGKSYLQDVGVLEEDDLSPSDTSVELTRHFRGLRLWFPLMLHGLAPFRAALTEKALLCRYSHQTLSQHPDFEVGPLPDLSVHLLRLRAGNKATQDLLDLVVHDGRVFMSSTTIDGVFWIRMAVLGFRTHLREVEEALTVLQEKAQEVLLILRKEQENPRRARMLRKQKSVCMVARMESLDLGM